MAWLEAGIGSFVGPGTDPEERSDRADPAGPWDGRVIVSAWVSETEVAGVISGGWVSLLPLGISRGTFISLSSPYEEDGSRWVRRGLPSGAVLSISVGRVGSSSVDPGQVECVSLDSAGSRGPPFGGKGVSITGKVSAEVSWCPEIE